MRRGSARGGRLGFIDCVGHLSDLVLEMGFGMGGLSGAFFSTLETSRFCIQCVPLWASSILTEIENRSCEQRCRQFHGL